MPLRTLAMRFALRPFVALGDRLRLVVGFRFALTAERCFEVEVRSKFVFIRRRRGGRSRRAGRTTFRPSRFLTRGSFAFLSLGGRPRWFRRRRSGLRLGRRRCGRFVQQQIFRRNLCVSRRFGTKIDAEQIFGQRLPRVFFATRAGAQRIGVHKALITIIKRTRGCSVEKRVENGRDRKALAEK
jgi:hypothetical protein